jgi:mannose-6-phosphate isomerase-like protein (cupin superfamily)
MADPSAVTVPAPIRRIVTSDDSSGRGVALSDGPATDVRTDPARPGFSSARIWVTDSTPARARGVTETLHLPHTLEPPPRGSVFRIVTFPPDASWQGNVGAREVSAFFTAMGSPAASTYGPQAPHPYMHRTGSLDFCIVLEGEITLVLDTEEVYLAAGDVIVQHGTNHSWSNRSDRPCTVAFTLHDGKAA